MRNFATQSGKSKGQFYTSAEVSQDTRHRVMTEWYRLMNLYLYNSNTFVYFIVLSLAKLLFFRGDFILFDVEA